MKQLILEIQFIEGFFKGQVWIFENLEVKDIFYHYEHFPMAYISESDIYVLINDTRIHINDFLYDYHISNINQQSKRN